MNSKTRMRYTSQKGITLIALVITIIVLLILAGVTINMVLGDDGIIAQAQEAKKANEDSSLKDAVSVAKGEAAIAKYDKQIPVKEADLGAIKTRIDTYNNGKTEADKYKYNDTVARLVDGVPIPMGFAYVEGTKKDTGLIVVDEYGNEYVWVPVDGTKVKLELDSTYGTPGTEPSEKGLEQDYGGDIVQEYNEMAKSVEIYGGFYVGRYETSWTGSRVASIPNVEPMNGGTPIEVFYDEAGSTWYAFYNKQKELYPMEGSNSVVSGMIYGSQWDAIMDWMSDVPNPDSTKSDKLYITDSTGMGHYCYDNDFNLLPGCEDKPIKTGSNIAYSVKNIFDLAGNCSEWTQEEFDWYRSCRGGYINGTSAPASYREALAPGVLTGAWNSSRLQLYIK